MRQRCREDRKGGCPSRSMSVTENRSNIPIKTYTGHQVCLLRVHLRVAIEAHSDYSFQYARWELKIFGRSSWDSLAQHNDVWNGKIGYNVKVGWFSGLL